MPKEVKVLPLSVICDMAPESRQAETAKRIEAISNKQKLVEYSDPTASTYRQYIIEALAETRGLLERDRESVARLMERDREILDRLAD
jgi:hypothetical protein